MKKKKLVLEFILACVNFFVLLFPIKSKKVTFVSLEGNSLKDDMLMIREALPDDYDVKEVLFHFQRNDVRNSLGYMFNAIKQIWHINRSKLVLINDNNFVISRFKRSGVTVIQVWHANGAIKKFGNYLERQYEIKNYDYVLANSEYWKQHYAKAFGVEPEQVMVTGLPKLDLLLDEKCTKDYKISFYNKYPELKEKKIVLYAPTFRGNIYQGIRTARIDIEYVMKGLEDKCVLLYKLHPLLGGVGLSDRPDTICVNDVDLYELFAVSDMLITDYSSIVFDYTLTDKPLILYASDLREYMQQVGCLVEYDTLPGEMCYDEDELINTIKMALDRGQMSKVNDNQYIQYRDRKSKQRVLELIENIMDK